MNFCKDVIIKMQYGVRLVFQTEWRIGFADMFSICINSDDWKRLLYSGRVAKSSFFLEGCFNLYRLQIDDCKRWKWKIKTRCVYWYTELMSFENFTELLDQDIDFVSGVLKDIFEKSNNEQQPIFCEESIWYWTGITSNTGQEIRIVWGTKSMQILAKYSRLELLGHLPSFRYLVYHDNKWATHQSTCWACLNRVKCRTRIT